MSNAKYTFDSDRAAIAGEEDGGWRSTAGRTGCAGSLFRQVPGYFELFARRWPVVVTSAFIGAGLKRRQEWRRPL